MYRFLYRTSGTVVGKIQKFVLGTSENNDYIARSHVAVKTMIFPSINKWWVQQYFMHRRSTVMELAAEMDPPFCPRSVKFFLDPVVSRRFCRRTLVFAHLRQSWWCRSQRLLQSKSLQILFVSCFDRFRTSLCIGVGLHFD
jgi:hypothetical protein